MLHPQVLGKSATAFAVAVAGAVGALGCIHHSSSGFPLYTPAIPRLPANEVAHLYGPIATVDGRDVSEHGRSFDLLPGCHIVVTQKQMLDFDNAVSVSGQFPPMTFPFRMKAGHTYVIERPATGAGASTAIVWIEAHDQTANGTKVPVGATDSERVIEACKSWSPGY
jgi:hypothetical protein